MESLFAGGHQVGDIAQQLYGTDESVEIAFDFKTMVAETRRLIEVKASTSVKDYHVLDCAIQDWVLRNSGINVLSISLAHINNQFVYQGDGNYKGLLLENDLTEEVRP